MQQLDISDFSAFFREVHGYRPLDWQVRLADAACRGQWPRLVDLPTGAGKTACLDIAAFALAVQAEVPSEERTAPLRTFLVVDRRIVVDDAFRRAQKICDALSAARHDGTVLGRVARRLLSFQADDDRPYTFPIAAVQLRGGIYRDVSWVRSATQPLLVTSTVDQVGSRMLFRGYGVSEAARPIHAALVACDSLVLLDEAHCSKAFAQTLDAIASYQRSPWRRIEVANPLVHVEMTATPAGEVAEERRFGLTNEETEDRESLLGRRRFASKPTDLSVCTKATGKKTQSALAAELAAVAKSLVSDDRRAIAVVVNRVDTAKKVYEQLLQRDRRAAESPHVELMIGRMRPWDRNLQTDRLRRLIASDTSPDARPREPFFVVATQCIEVGADLDFDAMVSEAAPLDALRQRFGRLNRTARDIEARGAIVIQAANLKSETDLKSLEQSKKIDDPVYGNSLARTWNALWQEATGDDDTRSIDFGIAAMDAIVERLRNDENRHLLMTTSLDAPILLPAHVDLLCQTSPPPWPEPDVSLWLHGLRRSAPDVNICWRADLADFGDDSEERDPPTSEAVLLQRRELAWTQAVSLCPPSSIETMPVPILRARQWLTEQKRADLDGADVPVDQPPEVEENALVAPQRQPLVWRGLRESFVLTDPADLRPGDTLVLPVSAGGWNELGFIPENQPEIDIAEPAFEETRRRRIVRLFGRDVTTLPREESLLPLITYLTSDDQSLSKAEFSDLVAEAVRLVAPESGSVWRRLQETVRRRFKVDRYTSGQAGIVVTSLERSGDTEMLEDDGDDTLSRRGDAQRVTLRDHLEDVERHVDRTCARLGLKSVREVLSAAARMHDWGKCDPRFQAMLLRADVAVAWRQPRLWAKSDRMANSRIEWEAILARARLPRGFRHEMLSMQMAEHVLDDTDAEARQLILHLIAAHHGFARPWSSVCVDDTSIDIDFTESPRPIEIEAAWRVQNPPDRADSGVADRFWFAVRTLGWWGASYVESVLRLADQAASARPTKLVTMSEQLEETLT